MISHLYYSDTACPSVSSGIAVTSVVKTKTSKKPTSQESQNSLVEGGTSKHLQVVGNGSAMKQKRRVGARGVSDLPLSHHHHHLPRLKFVNVEQDTGGTELIECQLETAGHQSVSFKFSRFSDRPEDIAANMVSMNG